MAPDPTTNQPLHYSEPFRRARRVFGCGVEAPEFERRYTALSTKERDGLDRVAQRVRMADALRHRVYRRLSVIHPAENVVLDDVLFHEAQIPSLEVFYLFGCIDTLASGAHQRFPDWLRREAKDGRLSAGDTGLALDEVIRLYDVYEGAFGVGANLRRIFANLRDAVGAWPADSVRVTPMDGEAPAPNGEAQEVSLVTDHLFRYFYRERRNPFAHQSDAPVTTVAQDVHRGVGWQVLVSNTNTDDRNPWGFWAHRGDGRYWMIYVRNGIDEATLLRMIVYGVGLSHLSIEVTGARVASYFRSLSRQSAFYGFLAELNTNSITQTWLAGYTVDGAGTTYAPLDRAQLPRLASTWAATLLERYDTEGSLEPGLRTWTSDYMDAVAHLNEAMSTFDAAYPPSRESKGEGVSQRHQQLTEFMHNIVNSQAFKRLTEMARQPAVQHLIHIANDPCYV